MSYSLVATKRSEKGSKSREKGQIPGIVYGKGTESVSVAVEYAPFVKLYRTAGEASLIDLNINGENQGKVLVQDVQHDPVSDEIVHIDLRRIDMNKAMTATVQLVFVGEAPIIKEAGGTLVTALQEVEVECLPKDLVSRIEIDISKLKTFDDSIAVKDLAVPSGIKITSPEESTLVVKATPAMTEDEIKALEEASKTPVDLSAIESAGKKKEEEGEEGAAEGAEDKGDKKEEKKEEKK
jgi:large subunit ribosomal protein L25